nr:hypothetical protein [Saprospiraceae bacterium]
MLKFLGSQFSAISYQLSVISFQRNYGIENEKDTFDWNTVILLRASSLRLGHIFFSKYVVP